MIVVDASVAVKWILPEPLSEQAETVTNVARTEIPDADFEAAASVFGEKELADLTIAIGLMNAYNRLAIGFRRTPSAAQRQAEARTEIA